MITRPHFPVHTFLFLLISFFAGTQVPKNCTQDLFLPNSPTKCSAVTNEECNYVCEPGYLKMGAHVCQANGRFAGGACNPAICSDGNTIPNSRTACRGRVGDVCSASPHPPAPFPVSMVCH